MNAFASFLKKLYIDIEIHMPDSTTDRSILRDANTLGKQKKRGKYRKSLQKFSGYPQENSKLAHIKTRRRCANYGLANTAPANVQYNAQSKLLMNPL